MEVAEDVIDVCDALNELCSVKIDADVLLGGRGLAVAEKPDEWRSDEDEGPLTRGVGRGSMKKEPLVLWVSSSSRSAAVHELVMYDSMGVGSQVISSERVGRGFRHDGQLSSGSLEENMVMRPMGW